ncbi:rhamnulose-1-phosphate aldolase [Enterococcus rivorum]|uniref:Rhamnulose-1-phosphate aldolase n=1 Tax=Enterococcus rivorum TaxID=762845 RepID=A0A1E5KZ06_9ENTE|nr:rhamnulose-1-phosphate aldolase [Enterococcus rivorum]MBP2097677.1 rhamnulose-1-phosphate aldolase [Enterococcus rivorum]OEH83116.1 rhamnulose-1-phosphate aldolase [Enterococcus rivorum]
MTKIHNIYEAPFIKEMCEATRNLWNNGWAERNGGNISYRLDEAEVGFYLDTDRVLSEVNLGFEIPELANMIFLVSGSGKYFKNVWQNPADNLVILKVSEDGQKYQVLWGLETGGVPTSELASHLKCHSVRLKQDPDHRVILHTHSIAISAMTFVHDLEEDKFTKTLWEMITECLIVFPDGVAILPWMVAGTVELGEASAEKMHDCRIVVWPHHGIMGAGQSMDDAFGLVETAEKAADIYLRAVSTSTGIIQKITDQQLWDLADRFGVTPKAGILAPRK